MELIILKQNYKEITKLKDMFSQFMKNQNKGKQKGEFSHRRKYVVCYQAKREISFFGKNIYACHT